MLEKRLKNIEQPQQVTINNGTINNCIINNTTNNVTNKINVVSFGEELDNRSQTESIITICM